MNFKDLASTCKDMLSVLPKDDITKRYLSTKNKKYKYVMNCLDKKEFDNSILINENLIQEFTFEKISADNSNEIIYNTYFSNLCIGSTHFRDVHDFDFKVISKLSMLELLCRTNMGTLLFKDIKYTELSSELKKLDWSVILQKDKDFSGCEIKIPFSIALVINRITQTALEIEDIFRKSVKFSSLMDFIRDLHRYLNADNNNIAEIYECIQNVDPTLLCSAFKMLLQIFNPLFSINVMKFLYLLPDIKDPELVVFFYQCLMLQIPEPERSILEAVLKLLSKVVEHRDKNNMCLKSVGTLFAPVLLNPDQELVNRAIDIIIQMIHYRKLIFLIPRTVINVHRNDNMMNKMKFEPKKNIGKRSQLELSKKSVVLSHYKQRNEGDFLRDETINKLTEGRIFNFKYKRRLMSLDITEKTTTQDVINVALRDSNNSSQLRLFECHGNIYQSCLHPNMTLMKAIEDNCSGKFFVDLSPDYNLVKSTLKSLLYYLKINFI